MSGREPCSGGRQHPPSPLPGGRTWISATAGTPRAGAWAAKAIRRARGHLPGASTAMTQGAPGSFGEGGGGEGSHPAQSAPNASPHRLHHHALLDSGLQDAKGKRKTGSPPARSLLKRGAETFANVPAPVSKRVGHRCVSGTGACVCCA